VALDWRWAGGVHCASVAEGDAATLDCGPGGGTVARVRFASYGTPEGMCGAYEQTPACHAAASEPAVAAACLGPPPRTSAAPARVGAAPV
jgi:hypothetical protein